MHSCERFDSIISDEDDRMLYYKARFDEYGILIPDDEPPYTPISHCPISYCPWCGEKFPPSKKKLYCEIIDILGYDGIFDYDIPMILAADEWYKGLPENLEGITPQKVIEMLKLKPKIQS